jgi:hypothetical protein
MDDIKLPVTPGQLWTVAKNDASWLQKHEKIVIVALVLIAGTFLGNKWLNWESAQKDAKVVALTALVEQDKQTTAQMAISAAQAQNQYQLALDSATKLNAQLSAAVAQESSILAQRQAADKVLNLPAVGQRMEALVPAAQGGVTATISGIALNDSAAHGILNALEQVPVLTAQLKDETQVAANNVVLLADADKVIDADGKEISGLQKSLVDQQAHEVAAVAAEKLKAKKAWRSGFKWGFGLGFAAGAYIVHAL